MNQRATQKGAPPPGTTAAPAPAAPPRPPVAAAAPAAPPAAPALPPVPAANASTPPPAPPTPPQAKAAPPAPAPAQPSPPGAEPSVNLGDSDADRDSLLVTGDDVVSSGPDARYRNMPPPYPRDAARRHEEGTVALLVHITPDGEAGEIDTLASSGSESLDEAARNAVAKWHFIPAEHDGAKVGSLYPVRFRFTHGDN